MSKSVEISNKKSVQILCSTLSKLGIDTGVVSPGSRNAPIIISLDTLGFSLYSIVDERSAGFFALGLAERFKKPIFLNCTSGSAILNYHPAVSEAFYRNIPLIVISADRPNYLIDKSFGQTIRQKNVLQNHTIGSVDVLVSEEKTYLEEVEKQISTVLDKCIQESKPIHINIQFDEPLYELEKHPKIELQNFKILKKKEIDFNKFNDFIKLWNTSEKRMILFGELPFDIISKKNFEKLLGSSGAVVVSEKISNLYSHPKNIEGIDRILMNISEVEIEEFKPDILLTFGKNIISKQIKLKLRNHKPKYHFHVDGFFDAPDTFDVLTDFFLNVKQDDFISKLSEVSTPIQNDFLDFWNNQYNEIICKHPDFFKKLKFSDMKAYELIFKYLPECSILYLGNSSVVRYAQFFEFNESIEVSSNRGTSGIEGCVSTAVGGSQEAEKIVTLIVGDLSFFYDSNALWNNYLPKNLRIIVMNNGGGNIFKIIKGPSEKRKTLPFFETPHKYSAYELAKHFGVNYLTAKDSKDIEFKLNIFYSQNDCSILEVNTIGIESEKVLKDYFRFIS